MLDSADVDYRKFNTKKQTMKRFTVKIINERNTLDTQDILEEYLNE